MTLPQALGGPVVVMTPVAARVLPSAGALPGGVQYEPKFDGFRAVVVRDGDVKVWSRAGGDLTPRFPEVAVACDELLPDGTVVDGELVAWVDDRLSFSTLLRRLGASDRTVQGLVRAHPAVLVVFDVLAVGGVDIRALPLHERRARLVGLGQRWDARVVVCPATQDSAQAREWFADLGDVGIEGVVAKGLGTAYSARGRGWVKVRHRPTDDVVVGAVAGDLSAPVRLVLGMPDGDGLRVVGASGALSTADRSTLVGLLSPALPGHPWADGADLGLTLVTPLVVEVAGARWERGLLTGPVTFARPRPDVGPAQVRPAPVRT